ncbi:unnamed protein product [Linum tenue]|uniref:Transmembrane protein n=1 Tax=Linum tenue TaxID=586396 RepID=A0AAV0JHH4_9ROSI|nr:unnamed protein product [Linum tenue]
MLLLLQNHHYSSTLLSPQFFHSPRHRHQRASSSFSCRCLGNPTPAAIFSSLSALPRPFLEPWLADITTIEVPVPLPEDGGGPIELPFPTAPSIFATTDDPSPLQIATSVLLTGAILIFLVRSIRRRFKRAKELRFRSSGATKKTLKDEALESLKAMGAAAPVEEGKKPTSPVQALLGGISAGVIALILYKFATTIEASLNRQTISDNFSVGPQFPFPHLFWNSLLKTVLMICEFCRTIINGLCYLATFVFGLNSVGLILYSAQLTMNSFMEGEETETGEGEMLSDPLNSTSDGDQSSQMDENSDDGQ